MGLAQVGGTTYSKLDVAATKVAPLVGSFLVFNLNLFNPSNAIAYFQFFDALTADVTIGATTPTFVIGIPAGGGVVVALNCPKAFHTGLVYAAATTPTGATALSANCLVSFDYVGG
jgi:hypothetical protein